MNTATKLFHSGRFKIGCVVLAVSLLFSNNSRGAGDWPQFRGPWGNGQISAKGDKPAGLPLHWSEQENVSWKTEIPNRGWSTPVVLGDQVWLTTATEEGHDFFAICVDANTGKILFNEKSFSLR